ncbi:MAG: hypothetical protein ACPGWR_25755 [Ardenticatenaceae bacterium]
MKRIIAPQDASADPPSASEGGASAGREASLTPLTYDTLLRRKSDASNFN